MKRAAPWEEAHTISSDDSSGSDSDCDDPLSKKKSSTKNGGSRSSQGLMSEDECKRTIHVYFANVAGCTFFRTIHGNDGVLTRRAKMYQDYMKNIPVPNRRGSLIPFTSWRGLAASLKLLYRQPLHYLTNTLLARWDRTRVGSETEDQRLDSIVPPVRAEAIVWVAEEVHRLTTSYHQLVKLWTSDPMYDAYIDSIVPSA